MVNRRASLARSLHLARDAIAGFASYRSLNARECLSRAELKKIQQRKLERLVRYAVRHSPFYADLYSGLDSDASIELESLPVVTKATLMENFDRVVTDRRLGLSDLERHIRERRHRYYLGRYQVHQSSGSSGQKGLYVFDSHERASAMAALLRRYALTGNPVSRLRPMRFANVENNRADGANEWGLTLDFRLKRLRDINPLDSLNQIVGALNSFQPDVLKVIASHLSLLAVEQLEGRLAIKPRLITALRDLVTPEIRTRVREAWGLELFEIYGASEAGGVIAAECQYHRGLHVFEDLSIMEVVDEEYRPLPYGVSGARILLTNLSSFAQPRIRFEIPDIVSLSDEACPCGRTLALLTLIEGRSSDAIRLPKRGGGEVKVTNLHLYGTIGSGRAIKEYQVVYDGRGLLARVVLREVHNDEHIEQAVRANLASNLERLGAVVPPIVVEIVDSDRIERDPRHGGKFKMLLDSQAETGAPL